MEVVAAERPQRSGHSPISIAVNAMNTTASSAMPPRSDRSEVRIGCDYPAAGQCSWPSQVPPKSAPCCGAGAGGAAGTLGQCSCPSQVPPKSLLAGGTPGAVGQCSCPSQVPPKSVPGAGGCEADVAGVVEPDDAGAPVVLPGVGVRVDETADEVVVLVTVTGALVPPEHPAANSATTATATPNVFTKNSFAAAASSA
jgi:hypothetical protein